jgi:hypothetical protein
MVMEISEKIIVLDSAQKLPKENRWRSKRSDGDRGIPREEKLAIQ